jgi:WD40 repeat protein
MRAFEKRGQRKHGNTDDPDARNMIVSLCFMDNEQILLIGFMGGSVRFYETNDLSASSRIVSLGHKSLIIGCRALPDQQRFATVSQDTTIKIWAYGDGISCISTLEGHEDVVVAVCFSPDENYGFTGSKDRTLCVWKMKPAPVKVVSITGFENTVFEIGHHPT